MQRLTRVIVFLLLTGCTQVGRETMTRGNLQDFLDFPGGSLGLVAAHQDAEERLAKCLKQRGYEYVPYNTMTNGSVQGSAPDRDLDSLEFRKVHGFGIADRFVSQLTVNPNDRLISSLSGAEMEEFERVYESCRKNAYESLILHTSELEKLQPKLQKLNDRIEADPQIVEFKRRWVKCMASKGLPFRSRGEMFFHFGGLKGTREKSALLAEEIVAAVADFECESPFREQQRSIYASYRKNFVTLNIRVLQKVVDTRTRNGLDEYSRSQNAPTTA
jgi:hypothetical protein